VAVNDKWEMTTYNTVIRKYQSHNSIRRWAVWSSLLHTLLSCTFTSCLNVCYWRNKHVEYDPATKMQTAGSFVYNWRLTARNYWRKNEGQSVVGRKRLHIL